MRWHIVSNVKLPAKFGNKGYNPLIAFQMTLADELDSIRGE